MIDCIVLMTALGIGLTSDEPKDIEFVSCANRKPYTRLEATKKEIVILSKDESFYYYRELKTNKGIK